ncbi:MAG: hypothetical protein ACI8W8_001429, partial [Rhodothermales bacterium]
SPTFGNGNAANAASSFIGGRFGAIGSPVSVTLAQGEQLTVTGDLVLTGSASGNNYRFGIFNDGGLFDANSGSNWTGGWMHQIGGDLFQGSTTGVYLTGGGNAVDLNALKTSSGSVNGNSATPFTFTMTVTRDSATSVDIVSSFVGGGSAINQQYTENDVTTALFTYTTVGFLFDGSSSVDQGIFSNVQYAVNLLPTLSTFAGAVATTEANIEVEITLADLLAQGDEADADGSVDAFVVKALNTGTLKLGASSAAATAFVIGSNDTLDASTNAYWQPVPAATGNLNAFTVVAQDDFGAESLSAVQAAVDVTAVTALYVDFGRDTAGDSPLQAGFQGFNRTGDGGAAKTQTFTTGLGAAGTVDVAITSPTHYRDYAAISSGPFVGQSNLLSDSVLRNANGTMTMTLSDLAADTYSITTYHHGTQFGAGGLTINLTDSVGTNRLRFSGTTSAGTGPSAIQTATFEFNTDGSDVAIDFVAVLSSNHIQLNGFALVVAPPDVAAPTPDPPTFALAPIAYGHSGIVMEATPADDVNVVEYFFAETSGNPGGTDSGWQLSPKYADTGLNPNATYSYTLQVRDRSINQNATVLSAASSAKTQTFSVDFGQTSDPPLMAGFAGFSFNDASDHTVSFPSASATDGTLEVTISGNTHYRDYAVLTGGAFLSLSDLLSDHTLRNAAGVMTLTIADLKPGLYDLGTFHHGTQNAGGNITVKLTDSVVTDDLKFSGTGSVGTSPSAIVAPNFQVTSDGSDVVITLEKIDATASKHLNLNGFALSVVPRATVIRIR